MSLPDDHPVELARRLFDALNTEEVEEARALLVKLADRIGVPNTAVRLVERAIPLANYAVDVPRRELEAQQWLEDARRLIGGVR